MRVRAGIVHNFSSYEVLEFEFTNKGLALIQGPTGSGKSTLCDVIPWVLFGKTAKGGSVDEVLSWPGDKVTLGTLWLDNVTISRQRGPKAKDNDLTFWPVDGVVTRGKDLNDTQRLINNLIGMDYDLYLAGAYFHEFSQTAQFFTTSAKNRRVICEQLVDLSLPKKLQIKSQEEAKKLKEKVAAQTKVIAHIEAKHDMTQAQLRKAFDRSEQWDKEQATALQTFKQKFDDFENRRQLDLDEARRGIQSQKGLIEVLPDIDLYPKCGECGQPKHTPEIEEHRQKQAVNEKAKQRIETLSLKIKEIKLRQNHYAETPSTVNPHNTAIKELSVDLDDLTKALASAQAIEAEYAQQLEDIELLQEVVADMRSVTIKNTISSVETSTNKLLSDHFDAEIRVEFTAEDADKLEVTVFKDGNSCSYTQLSKGQRCLLKLCFGVSVMQSVANHHGIKFHQAFFDEALDGLSEELKIKAYKLFETLALEYESIFVVEHSQELKTLFPNSYSVTLIDGKSQIAST